MADLERCYDEQASNLRAAFVAEVAALYQSEVHNHKPLPNSRQGFSRNLEEQMKPHKHITPADFVAFLESKLIEWEDAVALGDTDAAAS